VYLNLVTVFLLCGLWHGANWTFLVWGLVHGLFLVIERAGWERVLNRLWPPLRHAYLLLVLLVTWVLFRAESLPQAVDYLAALCGAGGNAAAQDSVAMYVNAQGVLTLAAAIVAAMPCVPWLRRRWAQGLARARTPGRWAAVGEAVVAAGVLLTFAASILMVAARTYSPFIYARF
jgi:alginate O-acetyltransferase complex protein AlgI